MAQINTAKVIAGGLLAGLVFNIGDAILNGVVLAADFQQAQARLGLDPAALQSFSAMLPWIVIDFCFGLLIIWTYAAMRPRFGPGPKTAILAGMVTYVATTLLFGGFTSMGLFPSSLFFKVSTYGIPHYVVGCLAGAWLYSEA